jgi:hypothetical protein
VERRIKAMSEIDVKNPTWSEISYRFLDALETLGYGVMESLELWNVEYRPAILGMTAGETRTWNIGKIEITLTMKGELKP